MVTKTKTKVICPRIDLCKHTGCMHYEPHDPVFHGDKPHQNCFDSVTICPIAGAFVKCERMDADK